MRPETENEDNEINVLAYFYVYPHASIRNAKIDLGLSYATIHRILVKHKLHPFKFITQQALLPGDAQRRIEFCEMVLIKIQEDPLFLRKIIWSDESKFTREGIFNRRNNHFWAVENPKFVKERGFQFQFGFNVFCLLMDNKFSYCIYEENLNSDKYLDILRTTVSEFLDRLPLQLIMSCWYQLDGAPAHCTNGVSQELNGMFEDRWIRRLGPWDWPPRSPDLTPLDSYLWGTMKERVYAGTAIENRRDLENRVRLAFEELDPEEIRRATTRYELKCLHDCLNSNGGHFKHFNY